MKNPSENQVFKKSEFSSEYSFPCYENGDEIQPLWDALYALFDDFTFRDGKKADPEDLEQSMANQTDGWSLHSVLAELPDTFTSDEFIAEVRNQILDAYDSFPECFSTED